MGAIDKSTYCYLKIDFKNAPSHERKSKKWVKKQIHRLDRREAKRELSEKLCVSS